MSHLETGFRRQLQCISGALLMAAIPTLGQQVTGTPGSPSATTTIDGRYLPAPPQKFQGQIGLNALESKPGWPASIVPPKGAPNILLIMTDDTGYGAPSTFGGLIPTPALQRVADMLGFATLAFNNLSGIGRSGTGTLKVDGKTVQTQTMERTIPMIFAVDETFDIGSDTGSSIDDSEYQTPFKFSGTIGKLTITREEPKLTPADVEKLKQAEMSAQDAK